MLKINLCSPKRQFKRSLEVRNPVEKNGRVNHKEQQQQKNPARLLITLF